MRAAIIRQVSVRRLEEIFQVGRYRPLGVDEEDEIRNDSQRESTREIEASTFIEVGAAILDLFGNITRSRLGVPNGQRYKPTDINIP